MRCLSLWEPWATLVAIGAKRFETRDWSAHGYRGPLAIHAAKHFTREEQRQSCDPVFAQALQAAGILPSQGIRATLGHVLCVVDVVDVISTETALRIGAISEKEYQFGNYENGRFAWRLENVRRIKPVPFKGSQSFFWVPDDLLEFQA